MKEGSDDIEAIVEGEQTIIDPLTGEALPPVRRSAKQERLRAARKEREQKSKSSPAAVPTEAPKADAGKSAAHPTLTIG